MADVSINNGEGLDKILAGDLVEETEVNMKESAWINFFCGNIGMTG